MANPYNGETAQSNKRGGKGKKDKPGKKASPSLAYRCPNWPGLPGKARAVKWPKMGEKKKIYPESEGL